MPWVGMGSISENTTGIPWLRCRGSSFIYSMTFAGSCPKMPEGGNIWPEAPLVRFLTCGPVVHTPRSLGARTLGNPRDFLLYSLSHMDDYNQPFAKMTSHRYRTGCRTLRNQRNVQSSFSGEIAGVARRVVFAKDFALSNYLQEYPLQRSNELLWETDSHHQKIVRFACTSGQVREAHFSATSSAQHIPTRDVDIDAGDI